MRKRTFVILSAAMLLALGALCIYAAYRIERKAPETWSEYLWASAGAPGGRA